MVYDDDVHVVDAEFVELEDESAVDNDEAVILDDD